MRLSQIWRERPSEQNQSRLALPTPPNSSHHSSHSHPCVHRCIHFSPHRARPPCHSSRPMKPQILFSRPPWALSQLALCTSQCRHHLKAQVCMFFASSSMGVAFLKYSFIIILLMIYNITLDQFFILFPRKKNIYMFITFPLTDLKSFSWSRKWSDAQEIQEEGYETH